VGGLAAPELGDGGGIAVAELSVLNHVD
jgi:hypothetical protein